MNRFLGPVLPAFSALALSGCIASMAASAVSMAVSRGGGRPQTNVALQPLAAKACTARAAQMGAVHVIDIEQRTPAKIIVWGTIEEKNQRLGFECSFGTEISDFKVYTINKTS